MSSTDPTAAVPAWLEPLRRAVRTVRASDLSRFLPPADGSGRHSAVLMLFGSGSGSGSGTREAEDADLLLILRAASMRAHASQVAFPGGASDPDEDSATATALREAAEEVGLQPESVDVLAELPAIYLSRSNFVVTPVLGYWREPHLVGVVDPAEVAGVARVRIGQLVDPASRFTVRHPSGLSGPGFFVDDLFIWGFTAGLIDRLLHLGGWERPWDRDVIRSIPGQ